MTLQEQANLEEGRAVEHFGERDSQRPHIHLIGVGLRVKRRAHTYLVAHDQLGRTVVASDHVVGEAIRIGSG